MPLALSACATAALSGATSDIGVREADIAAQVARQQEIEAFRERVSGDSNFAGIYVEHAPTHRAVVRFVGDDPATQLARYTRDPLYVAAGADVSYRALTQTQRHLIDLFRGGRIHTISTAIDVRNNAVVFTVVDEAATRREASSHGIELPSYVRFISRGGLVAERAQSVGLVQHFPQRRYPDDELGATIRGRLVLRDGCLRLGDNADSYLIVWPSHAIVEGSGETYTVRYQDSDTSVLAGRYVFLNGGAVETIDETTLTSPIPQGCGGPYWLAGSMIRQLN